MGSLHEFHAVNAVPIPQQVAGWVAVGKGFAELLCRPSSGGRIGHIEVQDFAALMRQDYPLTLQVLFRHYPLESFYWTFYWRSEWSG